MGPRSAGYLRGMTVWAAIVVLLVIAAIGAGLLWAAYADRQRGEEIAVDLEEQAEHPELQTDEELQESDDLHRSDRDQWS